jgi:hypothetical protein
VPLNKNVRDCQHIKVTGVQCGSPAMRGEEFCYFHQRMLRGVKTPPSARLHPIAQLESEEAIQSSLMEVINALVRNHIDLRRADLIIKALHIAVKNSHRVKFNISSNMVREVPEYAAAPAAPPRPVAVDPEEEEPRKSLVKNALAQLQSRALDTIDPGPKPKPVIVAVPRKPEPALFTPDPMQRKPQARAADPATTRKQAVNQRE